MDTDTTVPVSRKRVWMMICTVIAVLLIAGAAWRLLAMKQQSRNLPPAPEGFKWVRIDALSDEFTGKSTRCREMAALSIRIGRDALPSAFNPENVAVADGTLQLANVPLVSSMDEVN